MRCHRCEADLEAEELREHNGQQLCEDCCLDVMNPVKTCDPWAVHLAKGDKGRGGVVLTELQQKVFDLVQDRGEILIPEACRALGLTEAALRHEFATLRHMELLRGQKKGQDVYLTLF